MLLSSPPCTSSLISANPCYKTNSSIQKFHGLGSNKQTRKTQLVISKGHPRFSISDRNPVSSRSGSFRFVCFCRKEQQSHDGLTVDRELNTDMANEGVPVESKLTVGIGEPKVPVYIQASRLSLGDQAFFLLAFIACTTSIAFTSLVVAAVPTLFAMARAATSLSKLADTAREELPSTMAAIRLSGMEISDLTLELSDLSQEIADGVSKSAQAVQAAEAGIRQIGSIARRQTISIIQERASLPIISLQPVVAGAAEKTSRAVGHARKTFMNIISRGEFSSDDERNES